ncbi:MAG TPA: GNAT family N-acetyltransferase [Candidatus Binataceae bacterium]|nr:GNAT family N-acetyltransferase [Candidatus Binataceae bacterium]
MENRLSVRELHREELTLAADLTARGMRDNPLNIAAFGDDPVRRSARVRSMFRIAVPMTFRKGSVLAAFDGETLVAVAGNMPSATCQPGSFEKLPLALRMLVGVGPSAFARLARWLSLWAAHDLAEPHWHLGPVAVDAHLQGKGIGSVVMTEYCKRIEQANSVGYLETDKPQNVKFYEKFGFRLIGEATVLNVPNWFMRRAAR